MRFGAVLILIGLFGSISLAQMSPEEAQKRLAARQAERDAQKNKLVQIRQGDLDTMKAEIEALKSEIAALRAKLAATATQNPANADSPVVVDPSDPLHVKAAPGLKFSTSVDVGSSRQQLATFISLHKQHFRIGRDVNSAADHQEEMTVEIWYNDEVYTGTVSNGAQTFHNYRKEKAVLHSIDVVLVNGVIAQMSGKIDVDAEVDAKRAEAAAETRMRDNVHSRGRAG